MRTFLIRENKFKLNVCDEQIFMINAVSPEAAAQLYLSKTLVNECPLCLYATDIETEEVFEFAFSLFIKVNRNRD